MRFSPTAAQNHSSNGVVQIHLPVSVLAFQIIYQYPQVGVTYRKINMTQLLKSLNRGKS